MGFLFGLKNQGFTNKGGNKERGLPFYQSFVGDMLGSGIDGTRIKVPQRHKAV